MSAVPETTGVDVPAGTEEWRARQRRVLPVLVLAQVVGSIGIAVGPTIGVLLGDQVAGSDAVSGLSRTASTLGAALAGIPLAALALRRRRRTALTTGWAVATAGALLLCVASAGDSVLLVILGMTLLGVGSATGVQSAYAATDLVPPSHRARGLSTVMWAGTLGSVLGPNVAGPGAAVSGWLGLPPFAGSFVIAAAGLAVAAAVVLVFLRPDPLDLVRQLQGQVGERPRQPLRLRRALALMLSVPAARAAYVSIVCGHAVMVGVMTMAPVHMHDHHHSLTVIGLSISLHIVGMYAFAPVVGWLGDRIGVVWMLWIAQAIFLDAALTSGLFGASSTGMLAGLFMLGLGWSVSMVCGATLLSNSVEESARPIVQGTSDATMNAIAAVAAGLSGVLMTWLSYQAIALGALLLSVPPVVLLLRLGRPASSGAESC